MSRNGSPHPYPTKTNIENSFLSNSIKKPEENFGLNKETQTVITNDFLSRKKKRDNFTEEPIYKSKEVKKYQTFSPLARNVIIETVNL